MTTGCFISHLDPHCKGLSYFHLYFPNETNLSHPDFPVETDFNKILTAQRAAPSRQAALPGTDRDAPPWEAVPGDAGHPQGAVPHAGAGTAQPQGITAPSAPTLRVGQHPNRSLEPSGPRGCRRVPAGGIAWSPTESRWVATALLWSICGTRQQILEFLIRSERVALVFKGLIALTLTVWFGLNYITLKGTRNPEKLL